MQDEKSTSKYMGVYYSSVSDRWVVQLERHKHYPCFDDERDAGVYAEYYYRKLYNQAPNFPQLDDQALEKEFGNVLANRNEKQAESRSSSKQGLRKCKTKTSKYVGVFLKDGTRWAARIQYRGKSVYICSISTTQEQAEERAARAYDEKALELYGDKAKLNFPMSKD